MRSFAKAISRMGAGIEYTFPDSVVSARRYAMDTFSSRAMLNTARSGSVPTATIPWLARMKALSPLVIFFWTFLARMPVPDGA